MEQMKYGFYITGHSGRLLKFLREASDEERRATTVVFSDGAEDAEIRQVLSKEGIDYQLFDYAALQGKTKDEKHELVADALLKVLEQHHVDYCFSFGGHILAGKLLEIYKNRLINFHPSILPMYRGGYPVDQAINDGQAMLVGNTAHFIVKELDAGPIILQSVIPLRAFFETGRNYDVILDLQVKMLHQVIALLKMKRIHFQEDGSVYIEGADYQMSAVFPQVDCILCTSSGGGTNVQLNVCPSYCGKVFLPVSRTRRQFGRAP